jgi:hypothetical protein
LGLPKNQFKAPKLPISKAIPLKIKKMAGSDPETTDS